MLQEQPRRAEEQQQPRRSDDDERQESIKYGDVFNVSSDLAANPIAPQDARMMGHAETRVLGQVPQADPGDVMRAAAAHNVRVGLLPSRDISDAAKNQGIDLSETAVPGARVVTEFVGGQGATEKLATDKPVSRQDAEAVVSAEPRNNPNLTTHTGGVAASITAAARLSESGTNI
ncbi:late embryogenesis abundant protein D-34-like isoform X1 [Cucurbita pepo subsp. pepo]|uniref:late embryogenesis abundant protein D-34-like isoform X1 n=1 Tax=Cucurbita pepo subsp. pepo TaxID=3664 RepID=UPI000C9D582C|nr:late embryogenesis abundant protein D-34-like isoform X1 [Cucurbita pepo subsp. pepo]